MVTASITFVALGAWRKDNGHRTKKNAHCGGLSVSEKPACLLRFLLQAPSGAHVGRRLL